jgi:UDP-glucose 4-epimerase
MKRILVTGGAGFIGSHVVERFLEAGHEVEALDDLSSGKRENLPKGAVLHTLDIGSDETARLVARGRFDVIAHLAAQIDVRHSVKAPREDATVNVLGALNLLEAARALPKGEQPRVVFASTGGALYGTATEYPTAESAPTNPDSPYGVAKLSVEYYLAFYARAWDLETVVLRFGNVYGPRQDLHGEAGVIAIFTQQLVEGKPLTVFGTGKQTRDYIFVGDVANAFYAAASQAPPPAGPLESRAFNIGTGIETSVLEVAERLATIMKKSKDIHFAPARVGDIERSMLNPAKAQRLLGWMARVPLEEGLRRTAAWATSQPTTVT